MKRFVLLAVSFLALSASAERTSPLLTKTIEGGGPLPPGAQPMSLSCEIHPDRVVIQKTRTARPLTLPLVFTDAVKSTAELPQLIAAAGGGRIELVEGPTDGPTVTITGYRFYPNEFVILSRSGQQGISNNGDNVAQLIEFTNANCNPPSEVIKLMESPGFAARLAEVRAKLAPSELVNVTSYSVLPVRAGTFAYAHLTKVTPCSTEPFGSIVGKLRAIGRGPQVLESVFYSPQAQPANR